MTDGAFYFEFDLIIFDKNILASETMSGMFR